MDRALTFQDANDEFVARAASGARSVAALVSLLPGIYPADVVASLARLGLSLPLGSSERLLRLPGPTPHPIDQDWRLHPSSTTYLTQAVSELRPSAVALLGCPSLATSMCTVAPRVALADANEAWLPYLAKAPVDHIWGDVALSSRQWGSCFDVVVADPPWYPAEFAAFLTAAAAIVRPHGTVFVSWPGAGTRPGLAEEWEALVADATRNGLTLVRVERGALQYATPFFEARSLQAAGLPVFNSWRRADLVTFRSLGSAEGVAVSRPRREERWDVVRWRHLDLRVRRFPAVPTVVDPRLHALVAGDVLPSVSRRDPRRAAAAVWTSANRVFRCLRPDLLLAIAQALKFRERQAAPGDLAATRVAEVVGRQLSHSEEDWVRDAEQQLITLEETECAEYAALHEDIAAP